MGQKTSKVITWRLSCRRSLSHSEFLSFVGVKVSYYDRDIEARTAREGEVLVGGTSYEAEKIRAMRSCSSRIYSPNGIPKTGKDWETSTDTSISLGIFAGGENFHESISPYETLRLP